MKSGCPKGMSLRYTPKTNKKVFLYRYSYNGQKDFMLFEFIPRLGTSIIVYHQCTTRALKGV